MPSHGLFKVRLVLTPDPSGGFVVTSPDIPELITEGDTADEALANVRDALEAARELYADLGRAWPRSTAVLPGSGPVEFDALIDAA
jgi:antitoxin HicB